MIEDKNFHFSFVVVDIETTGLSYYDAEIIEIGAIRFDLKSSQENFSSFIKPIKPVPYFIYTLTNIKEDDLKHADKAKKVLSNFLKFLKNDDIVVCHNTNFDIDFLNYHLRMNKLDGIYNQTLDTLTLARIFLPFLPSHSLDIVAQYFNIKFDKLHRAIYDAEATGTVLQRLTEFIIDSISPEDINFLITIIGSSTKGKKFQNSFLRKEKDDYLIPYLERLRDYMVKFALVKTIKHENPYVFSHYNYLEKKTEIKNQSQQNAEQLTLENIFSENGHFSRTFENYEIRPGQIEMSKAVFEALEKEDFLLVEAGTGVGKSIAYLIPSLLFSVNKNKRIVVSTNTKNLQEQLLFKDIPIIMKAINLDFSAVLVKGRDNYLCSRKWQDAFESLILRQANISFTAQEIFGIAYLYFWVKNTKTGDVSENNAFVQSPFSYIWKKLSSDRHLCLGRKCRYFNKCYLMDVRQKAEKANLIIINHSLLFSDFQNEQPTLGDIDYLIFDEAHNLLHSAADYLGFSISYSDVQGFLNTIYCLRNSYQAGMMPNIKNSCMKSSIPSKEKENLIKIVDELTDYMEESKDFTDITFQTAGDIAKIKGSYNKFRIKSNDALINISSFLSNITALRSFLEKITSSLRQMHGSILVYEAKNFHDQDIILDFLERTNDRLIQMIRQFDVLIEPDFEKNAYWISTLEVQIENYPIGVLNYAPITVDDLMPDIFYRRIKSLIVTSATISLRNSFKYYKDHLGFNKLIPSKMNEIITTPETETSLEIHNNNSNHLTKTVNEKIVPSPFDYDKQTLVLNTAFLPEKSDAYFFPQSRELIKGILETNKVGTLILFTSYQDLKMMYEALEQPCFENDTLLLAQRISGSRSSILNRFICNGKAVLLGTNSFWEGIDVQGESLTLLIMYKLPFQVPTEPIVEAYLEKLEKSGKQSFMHYSLPNALLKMRQGIGRLIRRKTDNGVILILDNRITKKDYGKYFREICPTNIVSTHNHTETIDIITKKLKA